MGTFCRGTLQHNCFRHLGDHLCGGILWEGSSGKRQGFGLCVCRVSSVKRHMEGYVGLLALLRECFCLGICVSVHCFVGEELLKPYTANPLTDVMDCCSFESLVILARRGWSCSQVFHVGKKCRHSNSSFNLTRLRIKHPEVPGEPIALSFLECFLKIRFKSLVSEM